MLYRAVVGNPAMRDRNVAGVVGEAGGVETSRLMEILEDLGYRAVRRVGVTTDDSGDVGERGWERELRVENIGELRILVGPDVSAEESEDAGHRGLALVGRAEQAIEKAAVPQTTGRIAELPFGVVEVVVCAPNGEGGFLRGRIVGSVHEHPIEDTDPLQGKDVAVAHRQKHIPRQPFRIEDAAGLPVDRADLEYAFEVDRDADQAGPRAARVAVLRERGAHAFATARMSHHAHMIEVKLTLQTEPQASRSRFRP